MEKSEEVASMLCDVYACRNSREFVHSFSIEFYWREWGDWKIPWRFFWSHLIDSGTVEKAFWIEYEIRIVSDLQLTQILIFIHAIKFSNPFSISHNSQTSSFQSHQSPFKQYFSIPKNHQLGYHITLSQHQKLE